MNFTKKLSLIGVVLASLALSAYSQNAGLTGVSIGGTVVSGALNYAVISAYSATGLPAKVTHIDGTSDLATSKFLFYSVPAYCGITNTNTTVTIPVNQTNGFAANDIVVLRHVATDTYERRVITSLVSNSIVLTVAPTVAVRNGDIMYTCRTNGFIPRSNSSTNTVVDSPTGFYTAQPNLPLLIDLDGTSACTINLVNATYR